MKMLQNLKIVRETSGRSWNRFYAYTSYLRILTEGAEAPTQP